MNMRYRVDFRGRPFLSTDNLDAAIRAYRAKGSTLCEMWIYDDTKQRYVAYESLDRYY